MLALLQVVLELALIDDGECRTSTVVVSVVVYRNLGVLEVRRRLPRLTGHHNHLVPVLVVLHLALVPLVAEALLHVTHPVTQPQLVLALLLGGLQCWAHGKGLQHLLLALLVEIHAHEVPVLDEVLGQVTHHGAFDLHGHVVPWHARLALLVQVGGVPLRHLHEVPDACVAVVLEGEVLALLPLVHGAIIEESVLGCVPTAVAQIESAHEAHLLVDHDALLVVRPHEAQQVVGVSQHGDVLVVQAVLRERRVVGKYDRELAPSKITMVVCGCTR